MIDCIKKIGLWRELDKFFSHAKLTSEYLINKIKHLSCRKEDSSNRFDKISQTVSRSLDKV